MPPLTHTDAFPHLLSQIASNLDHWRCATRAGGIIKVAMDSPYYPSWLRSHNSPRTGREPIQSFS